MDTIKDARDKIMHSNGTSPHETVAIIVPSLFYTSASIILVTFLHNFHSKSKLVQFTIEFCTLVAPLVINSTIFADHTVEMLISGFIACVTLLVLMQNLKITSGNQTVPHHHQGFLTNARATIFIISVIAILAVDFQIFPRRFAKTEDFGFSLMDVGVGLFVFANGIVDAGHSDLKKSLRGVLPLLFLGLMRFIATVSVGYNVPVGEYGVHWNFFITLALIKVFVSLLFSVISIEFIWINASLLLISHEVLLQTGLKNFVLSDLKRDNFIRANREGLVSGMGYVCLYLLSVYYAHILNFRKPIKDKTKTILTFLFLSALSLALTIVLYANFNISRKLANSTYCFWVLFIGISMTGLFYLNELALKTIFQGKFQCSQSPLIYQAINYNGLAFFLISNLLTGLINISMDTLKANAATGLTVLFIYMFLNLTLICVLLDRKIKLKL